jgi:hypothetical protein
VQRSAAGRETGSSPEAGPSSFRGDVALVAHCDWSLQPGKRWMAVATPRDGRWQVRAPEPVGDTATLLDRLRGTAPEPGALLLGFDFPIGLPARYGGATGLGHFRVALAAFGGGIWADWYSVCEHPDEISLHRPFYPMRPGGTRRAHLVDGLGLGQEALLRRCDHATTTRQAACALFWTLGGNQVGKAAISGWREILRPHLRDMALWPFDGGLDDLLGAGGVVIAETYPGDAYGQLGIPRGGWSKRRQADRAAVAAPLIDWLDRHATQEAGEITDIVRSGFSASRDGEDRFDALAGLLAMIEVVEGRRQEGAPRDEDVLSWEGWILGQQPA